MCPTGPAARAAGLTHTDLAADWEPHTLKYSPNNHSKAKCSEVRADSLRGSMSHLDSSMFSADVLQLCLGNKYTLMLS